MDGGLADPGVEVGVGVVLDGGTVAGTEEVTCGVLVVVGAVVVVTGRVVEVVTGCVVLVEVVDVELVDVDELVVVTWQPAAGERVTELDTRCVPSDG